jgi:DNA-binding Lrp family transcriptional regulator
MSKTILADTDGFTPVIDALVRELGLMTAVVFGRVWRYCQMEDQVCKASLEKISEGIGVDRVTVMRHIKELCEHGYLKDLTPDLRNRPHVYADTGKAGIKVSIYGVTQSNTAKNGVSERNAAESQSDSTVTERNRGVSESHLNKDLKIEVNKEKDNLIETLHSVAVSIFSNYQDWHRIKLRLQKNDISISGDKAQMIVKGLSEPYDKQFTVAQVWQERYAPSFAKYGLELTFTE